MEVHRDTYLKEMIRWSGRGDFRTARECPDCIVRQSETPGSPEYRCIECSHPDLVCLSCCLKRHQVHPLHWIQVRPIYSLDYRSSRSARTYAISFCPALERWPLRVKVTEIFGPQVSTRPQQHVLFESRTLPCRPTRSAHQWVSQRCNTVLQLFNRRTPPYPTPPPAAIPCVSNHRQDLRNFCPSPTTSQASVSDEGLNV